MSDTPRTDAEQQYWKSNPGRWTHEQKAAYDFARTLERELNESKKLIRDSAKGIANEREYTLAMVMKLSQERDQLKAEADKFRAEVERLKAVDESAGQAAFELQCQTMNERDQWRAVARELAEECRLWAKAFQQQDPKASVNVLLSRFASMEKGTP